MAGGEHAVLLNALGHISHRVVVADFVRVPTEWVQLCKSERNKLTVSRRFAPCIHVKFAAHLHHLLGVKNGRSKT